MGVQMIKNNLKCKAKRLPCSIVIYTQTKTTVAGSSAYNWIKADPLVLAAGFAGWTIPSAIPVSGFGGKSLFSSFIESIGSEMSHFPTGPSLESSFWLYFLLYHAGLFTCLLLGQIGVQGRKGGYFLGDQ